MKQFKRFCSAVTRLLATWATTAATVLAFLHPARLESMMSESPRRVVVGLLFAGMKALAKICQPVTSHRSTCSRCRSRWVVTQRELMCVLIGGCLLGLVITVCVFKIG